MPKLRGRDLLDRPSLNKGTAFTALERNRLGLDGLLPPQIETLDEQAARAYGAYIEYQTDLGRHINLRALQDNNEVLFYRLLCDHIEGWRSDASISAASTGVRGDYSFPIRCAIASGGSCGIALTPKST